MKQIMTSRLIRIFSIAIVTISISSDAFAAEQKLSTKTLRSMARAYMAFGQYEKAYTYADRAVRQADRADTGETALCLIDMGTVYSYSGHLEKAATYFNQGIELQKAALFETHPYVAHTQRMLASVYIRQDKLEQAESTLADAVGIMLENCDLEDKEMAPFILESAALRLKQGHLDQAEHNYEMALDIYLQYYGQNHLMTANVQQQMAEVCLATGDLDRADSMMSNAISIKTRIFGRYHPMLIDSWLSMARICRQNGREEKSEYYLAKVRESVSQSNDIVAISEVFEQIREIRSEKLVAAVIDVEAQ